MTIKNDFNELKKEEKKTFIVSALVNAIPYIGSIINDLFFELPNKVQQNRINKTVEILTIKLEKFKEDYISKDYLATDDFFDFTRILFESTVKIKSEEKRKMLSSIYVKAIVNKDDFEFSKNRLFIDFVSSLSAVQIIILKFIQQFEKDLKEIEKYEDFYAIFCSKVIDIIISRYEFKAYCTDIENKGLISLGSGLDDFLSDESSFIVTHGYHKPSVTITDLGKEFLNYLYD